MAGLSAAILLVAARLLAPQNSWGACSTIPAPPGAPSAPPLAARSLVPATKAARNPTYFEGARGVSFRPYIIPEDTGLPLTRGCRASQFPPVAGLTVTLLLHPLASGDPEALVITSGDCRAMIANCRTQDKVKAFCATRPATELLELDQSGTRLTVKVPKLSDQGLNERAGPLTVAVTPTTSGAACALAKRTCEDWLGSNDQALVCIDALKTTSCGTTPPLRSLTVLPDFNPAQDLCHHGSPAALCPQRKADTIRYTVDRDGDILVPVKWKGIVTDWSKQIWVNADVRSEGYTVPSGDFIDSFTPDGDVNHPVRRPAQTTLPGILALEGTTDRDFSIVRLRTKRCRAGSRANLPCHDPADCPSSTCDPMVPGLEKKLRHGEGTVARGDRAFCEKRSKDKPCSWYRWCTGDDGSCVAFALEAAESPPPSSPVTAESLASALGRVFGANTIHRVAASAAYVAVIVDLQAPPPGIDPALKGDGRLLVASRSELQSCLGGKPSAKHGWESCGSAFHGVPVTGGQYAIADGVAQIGAQTRFIERCGASGLQPCPAGPGVLPSDRILRIYDADRKASSTIVAVVDPGSGARDPLAVSETGASTFVSPGGECIRNGEVLTSPDLCRPGHVPADCPDDATCRPTRIVVATNLLADRDGDGIVDALDPQLNVTTGTGASDARK